VRLHHAEGLVDAEAERACQACGDMASQSLKVTCHRAPRLTGTSVNALAQLEGRLLQKSQILLGGVVGHLEHFHLRRRHPESCPQA
jgi:hypothetical protein